MGAAALIAVPAHAYPTNDPKIAISTPVCTVGAHGAGPFGSTVITCGYVVGDGAHSVPGIGFTWTGNNYGVSPTSSTDPFGNASIGFLTDCAGGSVTITVAAGTGYAGNTSTDGLPTC
jgi:hypothetical protein